MGSETFVINIYQKFNNLKFIYKRKDSVSQKIALDTVSIPKKQTV